MSVVYYYANLPTVGYLSFTLLNCVKLIPRHLVPLDCATAPVLLWGYLLLLARPTPEPASGTCHVPCDLFVLLCVQGLRLVKLA